MRLILPDGRAVSLVHGKHSDPAPRSGVFRIVPGRSGAASVPHTKLRAFTASVNLEGSGSKSFDAVKEDERVVDYVNVKIAGYVSTFSGTTPVDRDGDTVKQGAFVATIAKYMKNPVLLANHVNSCANLVGNVTKLYESVIGLYFEASFSDSPAELVKDVRFKIAEGMLKTCSMGGLFYYEGDGKTINRVDLWEISVTPLPSNPDAIFETREPTEAELRKAMAC